jgi:hypothetical protein
VQDWHKIVWFDEIKINDLDLMDVNGYGKHQRKALICALVCQP